MKCKISLPVILYLLFLTSCEKNALTNIDLGSGTNSYELVIEGGISTLQHDQFIRLTKPAVLPNQVPQPISQATLLVNDGIRDIPFKETVIPGVYTAKFLNIANYNHVYTLKVTLNNKQFVAYDTLKIAKPIEAHYLPLTTTLLNDGKARLSIPKHTFGVALPQQWLIIYKGMAAWQPQEFDTKFSYSYSHVFGSPNALYPLIQESRTIDLNLNDSITVYKFSLSNDHSRFLYNIFQETDWKGLFSTTPGKIRGNVTGNAVGYFYADDVIMKKFLVKDIIY